MKTGEKISKILNEGKFPEVEITIGYFQGEKSSILRNKKLRGIIYEIDEKTNYCIFRNDAFENLIIHISSIKLI